MSDLLLSAIQSCGPGLDFDRITRAGVSEIEYSRHLPADLDHGEHPVVDQPGLQHEHIIALYYTIRTIQGRALIGVLPRPIKMYTHRLHIFYMATRLVARINYINNY